jgi:nitrate reductase NapAB chaperone NapD
MPVCSYLVIPEPGAKNQVRRRLERAEGCEVVEAENRDLLILLTDTPGLEEEALLRSTVEEIDGIEALLFTFGQIDPETEVADPIRIGRAHRGSAADLTDGASKARRGVGP